jgi:hypothetical protein
VWAAAFVSSIAASQPMAATLLVRANPVIVLITEL